jgi:SAM-dependent methyltransferase
MQWIAACPDAAVKAMLQEVGHPDLTTLVETIFDNPPDYDHLTGLTPRAAANAETFARNRRLLAQVWIDPKRAKVLDLGCGPLAPQTLLLNSAGYNVTGVDVQIPPDYLPLSGIMQRFRKGKYVKAWREATNPYYEALARHVADLRLSWKKVAIKLADPTRLEFAADSFTVVICANHLQHAPDVNGLLAEAARVLQTGGLFLADLVPYPALTGGFQGHETRPLWGHLRPQIMTSDPTLLLNQWREDQFRTAVEQHFVIEQWLTEQNEAALAQLTPEIKAELSAYLPEELTRKNVVIVARKP